jgi:hypothetical protein
VKHERAVVIAVLAGLLIPDPKAKAENAAQVAERWIAALLLHRKF